MYSQLRQIPVFVIMAALLISACQPARPTIPTPASTTPPPTAIPPTQVPSHPEAKTDAVRLNLMGSTMQSSPGELAPDTSLQVVIGTAAGQQVNIVMDIEPASGAALSIWGADGIVLVPETPGITAWEGVLPTQQDYYLNLRSISQQAIPYRLTIKLPPMVLPEATRIQFQPNTTGWYTPGEVLPNSTLRFVLGAMQGQQMTVNLITEPAESDTFVNIWSADGTVYTFMAPTKDWSGLLPASQDYFIEVRSYAKQPVTYQLNINIPTTSGETVPLEIAPKLVFGARIAIDRPIRFTEGPMAVELNGAVINGERDRYTLNALAGETLSVLISSMEGNAVFTIIGPDQQPLPGTEEGKDTNNWSVPIPVEGTYSIIVGSTRGNATYTLKVEI